MLSSHSPETAHLVGSKVGFAEPYLEGTSSVCCVMLQSWHALAGARQQHESCNLVGDLQLSTLVMDQPACKVGRHRSAHTAANICQVFIFALHISSRSGSSQ